MTEHEAADWLEATLPKPQRLSQRELPVWLGAQARKIGPKGWCADVGVWCGQTALAMALGGPTVAAVDTFMASDSQTGRNALELVEKDLQGTLRIFLDNIAKAPEPVRILPIVGRSVDVAGAFGHDLFDLVFIDADHSLQEVIGDLLAWSLALKPGGMLCGHDFQQPAVRRSVESFVKGYGWADLETGPDQLWWTRKPI